MSFSDKDVSNQKVQEKFNKLGTKYPIADAILERTSSLHLREFVSVMSLVDGVRRLLPRN